MARQPVPTINTNTQRQSGQVISVKTPNYWSLRKAGVRLPMNPYYEEYTSVVTDRYDSYNGNVGQWDAFGSSTFRLMFEMGRVAAQTPMDGEFDIKSRSLVRDLVMNELLAKMRQTPVDLGVALGEYRETANFVASTMVKTVHAMKAAKRGDLSGMVKIITGRQPKGTKGRVFSDKHSSNVNSFASRVNPVVLGNTSRWRDVPLSAAGTTLMANYALSPLISDTIGTLEALEPEWLTPQKVVYTRRRRDEFAIDLKRTYENMNSSGLPGTFTCSGSGSYVCRGKIEINIVNDLVRTLDILGLLNPVSLGYQLTPFSFVLDWFIPIGDYLQNFFPPQGIEFASGTYTEKIKGDLVETTSLPGFAGIPPGWETRSRMVDFEKKREVLTQFPTFQLIVPSVDLSKRKIANGVSLISQFIFDLGDEGRKPSGRPTNKDYDILRNLGMTRSEFRASARAFR